MKLKRSNTRVLGRMACVGLAALPLGGAVVAQAQPTISAADEHACSALAGRAPADVRITRAAVTPNGTAWAGDQAAGPGPRRPSAPVNAAFCRVQGVIEKEIEFELWLPIGQAWNGKFLGAGVGGDAGTFNFQDLPRGVNRGYAAATTDTGHKATDREWMLGDPQRLVNYELRANHLLAVKAKAIVQAYYAAAPKYSYFIGCSGGGRQGLKEMQRFPDDYDGVIAGASGPRTPEMTTRRMWEIIQRDAHPNLISPADWRMVSEAGVARCDELDGVKDGVAEDPRRCRFDVAELQCKGEKTASCLTPEQVAFAKSFYAPLIDENGRQIDEGILPGVLIDSGRSQLALGSFGRAVRKQTNWNGEGFRAGADLAALRKVMPELAADDADLGPFRQSGGKTILYTGWMDGAVAARMVTDYYDQVVRTAGGKAQADQFSRLYMMPGVFHCGGGPGPDRVGGGGSDAPVVDAKHDMLTALEAWVERGQAPSDLIVSKVEAGKVIRTRKLCPYPQTARYKGAGDTNDHANFECKNPV
jgi:feruloyl esterase